MHNASGLLEPSLSGPGRLVRVRKDVKGFVQGGRYVTPSDEAFLVDEYRAAALVKQGLVEVAVPEVQSLVERAVKTLRPEKAVLSR